MPESPIPTREQKEKLKDKLEREFSNRTKEKQIRFLNEAIDTLESFKQQVINNEVFIDNATMQGEHKAPTHEATGGHNIYISIDYIGSEEHHMNKVVRNF